MATLQKGRYRAAMATDAAAFEEQLPFYRIRPLYLAIVASAATADGDGVRFGFAGGGRIVSSRAALVVLWYGVRSAGALAGGIAGACRSGAAGDAGGAAVDARYADDAAGDGGGDLVRARAAAAGGVFADRGGLIRTDLEVFDVCLAGAWLLLGRREPGRFGVAGILAASVPVSAAVNAWAGNYGYVVLYRFTFVEGNVPHPASLRGLGFPFGSSLPNIEAGVKYSLENGGLWMVLALLGLCVTLLARGFGGRDRMCEALLLAVGLSTAVRFVLFPELDLRLVAPAVAVLTVVVLTIGGRGRGWVWGEKTRGLSAE